MHRSGLLPVGRFCGFLDLVSLCFETRSGYPKLLHFVDQRGPLKAKFRGRAFGAADSPLGLLQCAEDMGAFGVL